MKHFRKITEQALAWSVHIFTASGLLAGFMAILAISSKSWRAAMAWLFVALLIDGIDGTLARKFRTAERLPRISGKTIDYVVDFTTYAVIPAYFFYQAELTPPGWNLPLTFVILLVSAVYYGKEGMVSEDYYFIGFPVMWNMVVFYLVFIFSFSQTINTLIVIILAILHFLPVKFAYPSRATRLRTVTVIFTLILLVLMPAAIWSYPDVPVWLRWIAIADLAYFAALAAADTLGPGRSRSRRL